MNEKEDYPQDFVLGDEPDVTWLSEQWREVSNDLEPFQDQCRQNYEVRHADWLGRHESGKKTGVNAFPWEGASDLQVFLVDEMISYHKATLLTALRKASIVAMPVESGDIARAKLVSNFMRWLVMTQVPELEREEELAADYMLEKGLSAVGVFWESCTSLRKEELDLARLQQEAPQFAEILMAPENDEMLAEMLMQAYPSITKSVVKKKLKELRKTGVTTLVVPGQTYNRPVIRAFTLDDDLFVPMHVTDIEHSPVIFRKHYHTPQEIREKVFNAGWGEEWAEKVIETQRGKDYETETESIRESRNAVTDDYGKDDLVLVIYAYQKLSDEEGVPGIYETVFNPALPADQDQPGYGSHRLLDYKHGKYPFVLLKRERISRRLHDSRGIPEVGRPYQEQIKVQRDMRIDNASLSVSPPLEYPIGRPPTQWGPHAKVGVRRSGEYNYVQRPPFPDTSIETEQSLLKAFNQYFGRATGPEDLDSARVKMQDMVERWLADWVKVYDQVWSLYQQFGDDETYFRVIGSVKGDPQRFDKGNPEERYDFYMNFDVSTLEPELVEKRLERFATLAQTMDRNGQVDYSELLQVMLESVDPIMAERVIMPKEAATEKEIKEEQAAISRVATGSMENIPLQGANYQLRMQVLQQWVNGPIGKKMMQDEDIAKAISARAQQIQQQLQQQQNAITGRLGAEMPTQ